MRQSHSHGGPRPNAGRKPIYGEPTIPIHCRFPESLVKILEQRAEKAQTNFTVETILVLGEFLGWKSKNGG